MKDRNKEVRIVKKNTTREKKKKTFYLDSHLCNKYGGKDVVGDRKKHSFLQKENDSSYNWKYKRRKDGSTMLEKNSLVLKNILFPPRSVKAALPQYCRLKWTQYYVYSFDL